MISKGEPGKGALAQEEEEEILKERGCRCGNRRHVLTSAIRPDLISAIGGV